ncbi:MAG: DEAD/DEAH box helicase [Gilliamella sp.]|nr:DEAD/DEAH box helicase [Gilliamella sp.]
MSVNIITGSSDKPEAARELKQLFQNNDNLEGILYIAYPILPSPDGSLPLDALYLSEEFGLLIINIIEGDRIPSKDKVIEDQDNSYNKMESKLKGYKQLSQGRKLVVPIDCVTFAPALSYNFINNTNNTFNSSNFLQVLYSVKNNTKVYDFDNEKYRELISIIQNITNLHGKKSNLEVKNNKSKGAKYKRVEDSIANLDFNQDKAVIESVDSVQRIRGLAGSGKTIVLALKAAYLHACHPDWKIAVTFNTRSLKGMYRNLITRFYRQQMNEEPNFDNLKIIHAWGSDGRIENMGIYYLFCYKQNKNLYLDFNSAKNKYGYSNAFYGACKNAIEENETDCPMFDAILVDEAQDFSKYFLQICYAMLKHPKRLVYAYDELQNLTEQSLPSPEKIFGNKKNGEPKVSFETDSQDIILKKCYRNPRQILVMAHALGFGIYREKDPRTNTGLLQMFENKKLWKDIGYFSDKEIAEGEEVSLYRTKETSPVFLENHSEDNELIKFEKFESPECQANKLVAEIEKNITEDELSPSDIIVINPDPLTTKGQVGLIRQKLWEKGINSNLAGDTDPDIFISDRNTVTFSGIYRVKGNEAAMIYIINAQDCYKHVGHVANYRNILFTAMTRSKAWVRLYGVGSEMDALIKEGEETRKNDFKLNFVYPDKNTREKLLVINRDLSLKEQKDKNEVESNIETVYSKLESGAIRAEDIDPEVINKLKKFLSGVENEQR